MGLHIANDSRNFQELNAPKSNRFLVSPLDWGLGHATRLARLIRILLDQGQEVYIAADGKPYDFLHQVYPDIPITRLPLKQFVYSPTRKGFFWKLFWQIPGFWLSVWKSKKQLKQLVQQHQIDATLADNRYGFRIKGLPSIFVTHQLSPMPPQKLQFLHPLVRLIHLWVLRRYDRIWVADFPAPDSVVGKLSTYTKKHSRIQYIQPQSWLYTLKEDTQDIPEIDVLIMNSGPEPQRQIFENLMLETFSKSLCNILMLRGLPSGKHPGEPKTHGKVFLYDHLDGAKIKALMAQAKHIVCRAGVVTVFDLVSLGKKALLIPTPGQSEQEYVAGLMEQKGWMPMVAQEEFSLEELKRLPDYAIPELPEIGAACVTDALVEFLVLLPNKNPAGVSPNRHE